MTFWFVYGIGTYNLKNYIEKKQYENVNWKKVDLI